jgi:hypothetical protein
MDGTKYSEFALVELFNMSVFTFFQRAFPNKRRSIFQSMEVAENCKRQMIHKELP